MAKDWDAIEPEWRAGVRSVLQIAKWYGETTGDSISHTAINKHFKKLGIPRDLSGKVRAKADALVSAAMVSTSISTETESEIVNANAKIQSDIILAHRTCIPKQSELVSKLFAEIEALTDNKDIVEQMVIALHSGDMAKLGKVAQKVGTLPSRIKGVSDLVNAYRTLVGMERQAFGIDKGYREEVEAITEVVRRIVK